MGSHHLNSPLKIRGQVLPPGSTGVMIFLHFRLLHFFLKFSILNYPLSIILHFFLKFSILNYPLSIIHYTFSINLRLPIQIHIEPFLFHAMDAIICFQKYEISTNLYVLASKMMNKRKITSKCEACFFLIRIFV